MNKEKRYLTPARGLARGTEPAELRGREDFLRENPWVFLLFIFLRASASQVRSGSDEQARDKSLSLFQPDPLSQVGTKLILEGVKGVYIAITKV